METSTNNQQIVAYGSQEFHKEHGADIGKFLNFIPHQVYQIACGGLHTLILTTNREVYSFGSNKDWALGRIGNPKKPAKVELNVPVDMISAGESHSIACDSNQSIIYQWGRYKYFNTKESPAQVTPGRIGENEIKKKKIKKILSGANHTLVLAEGKVYVWGEGQWGIFGRLPSSRRKTDSGLTVETLGVKGTVEDIFTGENHAFLKKTETKKKETHSVILAWGYNYWGQLGIGSREKIIFNPTEVEALRDKNIENITGGNRHTLALTSEGEVFSFGMNDVGQLGLGKDLKPFEKEEESKEAAKSEETAQDTRIWSGLTPQKVELANVAKIFCGRDSNYAITKDNEVYCWGLADHNLLGPGITESLFVPTKFGLENRQPVRQIGLGKEHVVLLSGDTEVQLEEDGVNQAKKGTAAKKGKKKSQKDDDEEANETRKVKLTPQITEDPEKMEEEKSRE